MTRIDRVCEVICVFALLFVTAAVIELAVIAVIEIAK